MSGELNTGVVGRLDEWLKNVGGWEDGENHS